ncbi:pyridoxal phosphate-dependent decarboxylase family protein [Spirilliplanes yamanashiensis]|uniref:Amino acid decarboxylase n=1 Tax=Spirilliplanes yamanashiensis TaxID=42233 RepID=A0A8J3YBB5_9ACTN|nr:pyridoxal-dependent decarboxylase [Spirilliplanes yamanashiensis]MDP9819112.1 aromatic-L-amino-acid decarboxylase [Spirilliplanes yamanashiensis]GIJ05566.1 amino acid decarboxylase [Spirilliplanes yamanashiensis]
MTSDAARADGLTDAVQAVLPALEQWLRFTDMTGPARRRDSWQAVLDVPLPDKGAGAGPALAELADWVVANGLPIGAPGFTGFITTGPSTVPAVAQFAAAVASPQRYAVSAFNLLEGVSLRWLAQACGLDPTVAGVYSSGGSVANLLALGAARQAAFERLGVDVGRDGLPPGARGRIYAGTEAHHTIHRSAAVLGLGREAVRPVPVDDRQRVRPDLLAGMIERDVAAGDVPVAVVGVAGTTNTGAIDPLDALADVAERHGVWLHVDGAYGLPAAGVEELAGRFAGVRRAQSWIVDPHKWLATGVGCAATFVRDPELLHRTFTQTPAAYLAMPGSGAVASAFEDFGVHYDDLSVELSAPPRGVLVWAVLREIGRDGLHERIRRHVAYARRLTDLARAHPRLEALTDPELSVACLRYRPAHPVADAELDALNEELLRRLWRTTAHLPSSTVVAGRFAIRPCYVGVRHTDADVTGLAAALVELGDALVAERAA